MKIRVAAPPLHGAANDELIRFLSQALGVPRAAVRIVSGQAARRKRVKVDGLTAARVMEKLGMGSGGG